MKDDPEPVSFIQIMCLIGVVTFGLMMLTIAVHSGYKTTGENFCKSIGEELTEYNSNFFNCSSETGHTITCSNGKSYYNILSYSYDPCATKDEDGNCQIEEYDTRRYSAKLLEE